MAALTYTAERHSKEQIWRAMREHGNTANGDGTACKPAAAPSFVWRFGPAEFDEARWRLTVAGQLVELEPRPLEVLRQLLRYAGEVVRKDELVEAVYGHLHVSDGALNQAVSKLRLALGDREQKIIATVHRLGYRLAVPVMAELAAGTPMAPVSLQAGSSLPGREAWPLELPLSSNRQIEVWLARHHQLGEQRVFKISVDGIRLSSLKREVTLYRMLREQLGERGDFVRVLDWNFEQAPFFIETEYAGLDLIAWWKLQQGRHGVALKTRLDIVASVSEAVAAAHSVGVLHKDIKPSNILIDGAADGSPQARVADFGSGNLLRHDSLLHLGITRLGFTQTQATASDTSGGTPLYLAPEVISGNSATALSDVYSLGVVLYQLVVGDLRKPLAAGWERDIPDELLRQDIAAAVDGNPQRRMASARELAERIRTLEERRQMIQRQRSDAEQAAGVARELERIRARRPWLLTAALAVIAGLLVAGWFYQSALQASHEAREQAELAEAVTDFFNREVLSAAAPYEQLDSALPLTVREAVDRALRRIGDRFANQPATEGAIRATIGRVYGELTDLSAAIAQQRQAMTLLRDGLGSNHPRTLQAQYRLAQDLTEASQLDEARQLIEDADAASADGKDLSTALAARLAHCYLSIISSQYAAAVPHCEATLALQRQLDPSDGTSLFKRQANLATLYSRMGQFDKAEPLFVEGLEILRREGGANSPTAARFENLYGINLLLQRRYPQAEAVLQRAYQSMVARDGSQLYAHETLGLLATVYSRTGRAQLALQTARISYEGYRDKVGDDNHYTAQALTLLGVTEMEAGLYGSGLLHLRAASQTLAELLGETHPQTQRAHFYLARSLIERNESIPRAQALVDQLVSTELETASAEGDWAPRVKLLKARLLDISGRPDDAAALAGPAVAELRRLLRDGAELSEGAALLQADRSRS